MDFYKQYPSGLRLVAKSLDGFYTVCVGVFVDVGCVKENAENNGYSHFIEHLLFKGTKKRTALGISEEIDDIGANINAYTAKDNTCFYTKSAADDMEKCLDVLSDLAAKALFCKQTLGQTILGTPHNIKYSDRHSILKFKEKHYVPSATVISVCGKFDFDKLDKLIERYFESNCRKDGALTETEPPVRYCSEFYHSFKQIEQSHLQMAWGGFGFGSDKRYANNILASVVGGGMTSRLYQKIREQQGLAYTVYAYPSYYSQGGTFEIYAGLSAENIDKTCGIVSDELNGLLQDGITDKELARASVQAVNSLYMNVESSMTLMRLYGRSVLKFNEVFDIDKEIQAYKSVTVDDVNAVARQVFSAAHASSYVGIETDAYKSVSKIKIG